MPSGFDVTTCAGRVALARHFLLDEEGAALPGRPALLASLDALGTPEPKAEHAFWADLALAAYQSQGLVGAGMRALVAARHGATQRLPRSPGPDDLLTRSDHRRVGRSARLVRNVEEARDMLANEPLSPPARLRMALGALAHVAELVGGGIWEAYTPPKAPGQVKAAMPLYKSGEIQEVMEVASWTGLPLRLQRLRNAWVHGDAWVAEGRLHVQDDEAGPTPVAVTPEQVETYLAAGLALWWIYLLDLARGEAAKA